MNKYYPYLFLTLLSIVLFVPGISSIPVIDRDEAHFAQASRQMLEKNEYFQIRFQDKTRYQKPPGINWLQSTAVSLFSSTDSNHIWPYRLPSVLGAWFSVLLTYMFARRFMPDKSALWGSGFLACALLLLVESHMAVIDTSLLSSVVLMQGALWVIYSGYKNKIQTHWVWAILFWLAMAYGFVLKGVTPLVGGLTLATLCIIEQNSTLLRRVHIVIGLLLFLGLSLLWLLQVNAAENSNYLLQMFQKDLLPKLQGGHESHGQPPLFHLVILPLTLWPASLFLWPGIVFAYQRKAEPWVKFLLSWIIPTWIFFELMPTKLPQYVLPTFPAIALLMASSLTAYGDREFKEGKLLKTLQILWGVLTLGLALAVLVLPYFIVERISLLGWIIFIIMVVLGVFSVYYAFKKHYKYAVISILTLSVVSYSYIFSVLLPSLAPIWATDLIKNAPVSQLNSTSQPLMAVGYHEPSLVMVFGTNRVVYSNISEAVSAANQHVDQLILIDGKSIEKLPDAFKYHILWQHTGFNYSKGKWLELFLIQKASTKDSL